MCAQCTEDPCAVSNILYHWWGVIFDGQKGYLYKWALTNLNFVIAFILFYHCTRKKNHSRYTLFNLTIKLIYVHTEF